MLFFGKREFLGFSIIDDVFVKEISERVLWVDIKLPRGISDGFGGWLFVLKLLEIFWNLVLKKLWILSPIVLWNGLLFLFSSLLLQVVSLGLLVIIFLFFSVLDSCSFSIFIFSYKSSLFGMFSFLLRSFLLL